jgi:hypothetical protein
MAARYALHPTAAALSSERAADERESLDGRRVAEKMELRSQRLFLALILTQAAHSIEEYAFRLYEVLAPARIISGLVSSNLAVGFASVNAALVLFGFWCYFARVRKGNRSGRGWAWFWTILEASNGTGHLLLAAGRGAYFPGAATAPLLLGCASWLGVTLARAHGPDNVPRWRTL